MMALQRADREQQHGSSSGGWATVAGGMGGIAERYRGPRAGEDDGGWDDFEDGEDRRLPREYLNSGGLRTAGFKAASMDQAIPSSNPGFQLLQKMGWNAGQGLGKKGQGRVDPVRLDANEFKMGLGKNSEYNYYAVEATKERLKLDSEIDEQLVRERREGEALREESIAHQAKKVLREFYCDICDVQYQTVMQMEEHLSSYNHNHKKRFVEMKAMMKCQSSESAEERETLMAKREMEKAMKLASAAAVRSGSGSAPTKPPDKVVESLESGKRSAVKVSLLGGGGKKKGGLKPKPKKPIAVFSMDDDDE